MERFFKNRVEEIELQGWYILNRGPEFNFIDLLFYFKVYDDPDESYYLSLWMGVTLGTLGIVLVAFLGILYWIWRTSISKDYARYDVHLISSLD